MNQVCTCDRFVGAKGGSLKLDAVIVRVRASWQIRATGQHKILSSKLHFISSELHFDSSICTLIPDMIVILNSLCPTTYKIKIVRRKKLSFLFPLAPRFLLRFAHMRRKLPLLLLRTIAQC